ncbi:MAG: hypothetical protein QOF83_1721 [Solirubrobacteraceae bacterium]|jgi:hypothetical protein|nr:hypothetical protein [Solirubrobacteraceae bacterium]
MRCHDSGRAIFALRDADAELAIMPTPFPGPLAAWEADRQARQTRPIVLLRGSLDDRLGTE